MTSAQFADNSRDIIISMIGRPLKAMIAIATLVGVALIGLTVLASTNEQMADFGVLRAVGVRPAQLLRAVAGQAAPSPRWDIWWAPRWPMRCSSSSATGSAT